jgi:hypothetical protein
MNLRVTPVLRCHDLVFAHKGRVRADAQHTDALDCRVFQGLQAQLARAAGNGSLVAALEAASAFVPDPSTGPRGLMITLRTRSIEDLAAFALGQVCTLLYK